MAAEQAVTALRSDKNGLSSEEAATRLAAYGRNRLPAPVKQKQLYRFFRHFHNILIYVLLGSTVAVPFWDGVIIVCIGVVLFAIIETEKQLRLRLRKLRYP